MLDYIPLELISNILATLPIADVLRFTSVCKSWYNLITSPSFISSHLNSSIPNTQSRVLIGVTPKDNMNRLDHYYLYRDNKAFEEIEEVEPPENDIVIYGSSNGVFCCFGRFGRRFMLWNPSLRKSLILPRSTRHSQYSICYFQQLNVGFGYLPLTNNFKIVKVLYTHKNGNFIVPPEVQIYEFYTSSWRDLNAVELLYVLEYRYDQALLNGIVHWTARDLHRVEGVIVSFDLTSEIFGTLVLPKCVQSDNMRRFIVSTLKESLCLFHGNRFYGDQQSVFIMKEYGVTDSWEKLFKFDSKYFEPRYIRENSEILGVLVGEEREKYNLVSCDPKTNEVIDLGVQDARYIRSVDPYVDSLFLI